MNTTARIWWLAPALLLGLFGGGLELQVVWLGLGLEIGEEEHGPMEVEMERGLVARQDQLFAPDEEYLGTDQTGWGRGGRTSSGPRSSSSASRRLPLPSLSRASCASRSK